MFVFEKEYYVQLLKNDFFIIYLIKKLQINMKVSTDQCYDVINTCFSNKFTSESLKTWLLKIYHFLQTRLCTRFAH